MNNSIGFIGLGLMGEAMSTHLVNKFDGEVMVYDINSDSVARMVAVGAKAATSIAELAQQCNVIISMVPRSEHVKAVYAEMIPHLKAGKITVDMSTIDPSVSVALSHDVAKTGAIMLDAPVVKSVPAAKAAELGIYVGGDKNAWQKVSHILSMMGCNQIHLGDNGRGLVMKILHNVLVAQIQNSVNEMLSVADLYGIEKSNFNTAVSYGGASNFYLTSKINSLIDENYTTAFSLENMAKDIGIMQTMMAESNLNLPGANVVNDIYQQGLACGLGKEDFCATYKLVRKNIK
jgi:3-hydroxyisobutyrate dehydrogenase